MNSNYRILKLKSGEELITKIVKRLDGKLLIEYPMTFRTMILPDPMSGHQKEITVLRDWISYTVEKEIKIPENYILSYSVPEKEAIELYDIEKRKKTQKKKNKTIKKYDIEEPDMKKELGDLIDKLFNNDPDETEDYDTEKSPPMNWFHINPESLFKEMLDNMQNGDQFEFEFTFPPEEINHEETTEEETHHPDYGNRWTDWNSDPNEY
tara:strand:- start:81 stop:707 length:627 start_codon:yes stop_codon:yes gene_type:complete